MVRRSVLMLISTAALVAGLVLAAPAASGTTAPASNPYTPQQVCGSGYQVIDRHLLAAGGIRYGEVFLLYSPTRGTLCVVTLKYHNAGTPGRMSVVVEFQGGPRRTDYSYGSYYAGPLSFAAG